MAQHQIQIGGLAAVVVIALASAPGFTGARAQVAAREGNIWGGFDHQPVPSQVLPQERAAGVAPPAAVEQQENKDVDRLYRELMQSEGQPAR